MVVLPSGKRLHNYGTSHFLNGKIHYKTQFSIAMLVYQRALGGFNSEKYDFVSWDDDIPYMEMENKNHVPNHQPVILFPKKHSWCHLEWSCVNFLPHYGGSEISPINGSTRLFKGQTRMTFDMETTLPKQTWGSSSKGHFPDSDSYLLSQCESCRGYAPWTIVYSWFQVPFRPVWISKISFEYPKYIVN